MYGMRYLSIVTTRFVKCAIGKLIFQLKIFDTVHHLEANLCNKLNFCFFSVAFTWIGSLIWAASSYFAFNGKVSYF